MLGDAGCVCYDPRFETPPPGTTPIACDREKVLEELGISEGVCYIRPLEACKNYHLYSPPDYDALQEWIRTQCWGPREAQ